MLMAYITVATYKGGIIEAVKACWYGSEKPGSATIYCSFYAHPGKAARFNVSGSGSAYSDTGYALRSAIKDAGLIVESPDTVHFHNVPELFEAVAKAQGFMGKFLTVRV